MENKSNDSRTIPSKFPALGMLYYVVIMHLSHTTMERFVTSPLLGTFLGAGCASLVCTQAWDNKASTRKCLCVEREKHILAGPGHSSSQANLQFCIVDCQFTILQSVEIPGRHKKRKIIWLPIKTVRICTVSQIKQQ